MLTKPKISRQHNYAHKFCISVAGVKLLFLFILLLTTYYNTIPRVYPTLYTTMARVSLSPQRSPLLSRTVFWYRAAQKAITILRATKHLLPAVGCYEVLSSRFFLNTHCLRMHECLARVRVYTYFFAVVYVSRLGR